MQFLFVVVFVSVRRSICRRTDKLGVVDIVRILGFGSGMCIVLFGMVVVVVLDQFGWNVFRFRKFLLVV